MSLALHERVALDELISLIPGRDIMSSSGYFRAVNDGVSGETLKKIIAVIDEREIFARVVGKDITNLSKSYRLARLPKVVGDGVIDTLRVYIQATRVFGEKDLAAEWLHTQIPALGGEIPVDLMDSPSGRELVRQALQKIEFGEYS